MQAFHIFETFIELHSCHDRPSRRKVIRVWVFWLRHLDIFPTSFHTLVHHITLVPKRLPNLFCSIWMTLLKRILIFEFKWFLKQHQVILNAIPSLFAPRSFFLILFLSFFESCQVNRLVLIGPPHLTVNFYYNLNDNMKST